MHSHSHPSHSSYPPVPPLVLSCPALFFFASFWSPPMPVAQPLLTHSTATREDGRFPDEMRRIVVEHTIIGSRGHITLSQGQTRLSATVSPLTPDKLSFSILFHGSARAEPPTDRWLYETRFRMTEIFSSILLTEQPVAVEILVLQDDGGLMASVINITTLILCYYGIPMREFCVAVCLGQSVDPSFSEQRRSFSLVAACLFPSETLLYSRLDGRCQRQSYDEACLKSLECARWLKEFFSAWLRDLSL